MLRFMNSAISGMQSFQTDLDVVGNNIANVNTIGFKSGRADFSTVLSQTLSGGSSPISTSTVPATPISGGTNPMQVGLGTKISDIQTLFAQGATSTTGNMTDLDINGDGLFIVSPNGGTNLYYSRAGNFTVDSNYNLTLPTGDIAYGFDTKSVIAPPTGVGTVNGLQTGSATSTAQLKVMNLNQMVKDYQTSMGGLTATTDPNYNNIATTMGTYASVAGTANGVTLDTAAPSPQIAPDGSVSVNCIVTNGASSATMRLTVGHMALATLPNYAGLASTGDSTYQVSSNSGSPTFGTPGYDGSGTNVQSGALEMSNVDLTKEFSEMIVAQNGFAANSHVIGTANSILQDVVNMKNS